MTHEEMIDDMKNMDTFNQIQTLTIRGNIQFDQLPNNLKYLDCFNNQLSKLPDLPNKLTYLNCSNNQLSGLPNLPNTLIYLDCRYNQ